MITPYNITISVKLDTGGYAANDRRRNALADSRLAEQNAAKLQGSLHYTVSGMHESFYVAAATTNTMLLL